jgi:hypothetical protein
MSYESKTKCSPKGNFIQDSVSSEGCQINPIVVNFYLQKSLEISDENSADKIWSKKDKEIKVQSPLMPIRVNT